MTDLIAGKYELYRVILDYDALKEGFADRIEDLNTPMSEIDSAAGLTPGHTQKLLIRSDADWSRGFTWKTLGPMLKGTGLALVLVVDDERFAAVKATLVKRRRKNVRAVARIHRVRGFFTTGNARKYAAKRWDSMPADMRSKVMKKVIRARWSRRNRKRLESEASHA